MAKTIYITINENFINVEAEKNNGYGVSLEADRAIIESLEELIENSKSKEEVEHEQQQQHQNEIENKAEKLNLALIVLDAKLNDSEKLKYKAVYPLYKNGEKYSKDMAVPYVVFPDYENGKLYKIISANEFTSQSDWTPDVAVSLFAEITPPPIIPEFKQPTGVHDAYHKGNKCTYVGRIWECLAETSVYSPIDYPPHWKDLGEYDEN